jgi:hypothetical protein
VSLDPNSEISQTPEVLKEDQSQTAEFANPVVTPHPPKKPNWDRFIGIVSILLAFLLFALQANGVEINWQFSLIAYIAIAAGCIWACLRHAVPHLEKKGRYLCALGVFAVIAVIGSIGTFKQYHREHIVPPQPISQQSPAKSDVPVDTKPPVTVERQSEPRIVVVPVPSTLFPVVVKVHVDVTDTVMVENEGKAAIIDVVMEWGKFNFDKASVQQKRIVISEAGFPSRGYSQAAQIPSGKSIRVDLKKFLPFQGRFRDLSNMSEWPFPEIGLRVTFRDKQTGQKYACYKVFSSIEGLPEEWGDEVATSGTGKPEWFEDIYSEVIAGMKAHYDDGAIDFHCDR